MPRYDYRCPADHVTQSRQDYSVQAIHCACGLPAQREPFTRGHLPGTSGFVPTPTRERYINLNRAVEAQHELVYEAEKHHVELPDFWQIAKDRVTSGDVKAIE